MAAFYNEPNPTSDPNYMGYSKEPEKIKANTSFGDLFGSAGTTLGEGAGALDRGFQDILKSDERKGLQSIIEAHSGNPTEAEGIAVAGTGARSGATVDASGNIVQGGVFTPATDSMPDGLRAKMDNAAKIKQIYSAGKMSETHFDIATDSFLRTMRQNYPAYEDQIDAFGKSFIGTSMANEVRKDVFTAMNAQAAAAQSATNKLQTEYHQDAKYYGMSGVPLQKFMSNPDAYRDDVVKYKAEDYRLDREDARLKNANAKDANTVRDTTRLMSDKVNMQVDPVLRGALSQLQDENKRLLSQDQPSMAEVRTNAMKAQILLDQVATNIDATMSHERFNNQTPEQKKAVRDLALDPFRRIGAALIGGNTDLATAIAKQKTADKDLRTIKFNQENPYSARVKTMSEDLPPDIATAQNQVLGTVQKVGQEIIRSGWLNVANKNTKNPPAGITEIEDATKRNPSTGEYDPDRVVPPAVRSAILNGLLPLRDGKDPVQSSRAIRSIYDPEYFAKIDDKSELKSMWQFLSKPSVSQKVAEIDREVPGAADVYRKFNETLFRRVFSREATDAQTSATQANPVYKWKWDEGTAQIQLEKIPGIDYTSRASAAPALLQAQQAQEINRLMRIMGPMYTALNLDINVALPNLLNAGGFDMHKEKDVPLTTRAGQYLYQQWHDMIDGLSGPGEPNPVRDAPTDGDTLPKNAKPTAGYAPEDIITGLSQIVDNGIVRGQQKLNRTTGKYEDYREPNQVQGKSQDRVKSGTPFPGL